MQNSHIFFTHVESGEWVGHLQSKSRTGNYFFKLFLQATLRLFRCLAGQILVKKANNELKIVFAGRMWPAGRMLPTLGLNVCEILYRCCKIIGP